MGHQEVAELGPRDGAIHSVEFMFSTRRSCSRRTVASLSDDLDQLSKLCVIEALAGSDDAVEPLRDEQLAYSAGDLNCFRLPRHQSYLKR